MEDVDKSGKTPKDYKCSKCSATNIKLSAKILDFELIKERKIK